MRVEINELDRERLKKTVLSYRHAETLIGKKDIWGEGTKALLECAIAVLSYYGESIDGTD